MRRCHNDKKRGISSLGEGFKAVPVHTSTARAIPVRNENGFEIGIPTDRSRGTTFAEQFFNLCQQVDSRCVPKYGRTPHRAVDVGMKSLTVEIQRHVVAVVEFKECSL